MPTDLALAERAVEQTLGRADRVYGHSPQALKDMLADADKTLAMRLAAMQKRHGGPNGTFTEQNAKLVRKQVQLVQQYVDQRLLGLTHDQASKAVALSVRDTVKLAKGLERHFTGISKPLNLEQASVMDPLVSGTNSSLLSRHKSSVQRYGRAMVNDFERVIRTGFVEGLSNHEVIRRMVSTGAVGGITALSLSKAEPAHFPKPTGYMRKQYWAERIVRTETAYAYNRANLNTLAEARNQDFPDMQKKILATFDKRTAPDSIAVHGQIRKLDEKFRDGKGREYLHPPGRPNDRETVVPWRPEWQELPNTVPTPPKQAAQATIEATPGTDKLTSQQKWTAMRAAIASKKAELLGQVQQAKAQAATTSRLAAKAARAAANQTRIKKAQEQALPEIQRAEALRTMDQVLQDMKAEKVNGRGITAVRRTVQELLTRRFGLKFDKDIGKLGKTRQRPGLFGFYIPYTKEIRLTGLTMKEFRATMAQANKRAPFISGNGVKTLLHELSHSALQANWSSYSLYSGIEEALTELLAHKMTRDLGFRTWEITWERKKGSGWIISNPQKWKSHKEPPAQAVSYRGEIERLVNRVIHQGYVSTPAQAQELLTRVSIRMRREGSVKRSIKEAYEEALEKESGR
jgi:hypothetical protein